MYPKGLSMANTASLYTRQSALICFVSHRLQPCSHRLPTRKLCKINTHTHTHFLFFRAPLGLVVDAVPEMDMLEQEVVDELVSDEVERSRMKCYVIYHPTHTKRVREHARTQCSNA